MQLLQNQVRLQATIHWFKIHCLTFAFPLQLVYILNSSGQTTVRGSLLQGCF